jgi:hypothetical protein
MSLIETGIPIPESAKISGRSMSPHYAAWRELKVGESVFLPNKKLETVRIYRSSAQMKDLRDAGHKYHIQAAEKDGVSGVRVWRTA